MAPGSIPTLARDEGFGPEVERRTARHLHAEFRYYDAYYKRAPRPGD